MFLVLGKYETCYVVPWINVCFLCVDALYGIKDLFKNHPEELQSHKYAIIQKLRERICDDDKLVRDAFYQLFKIDIFPACKEV